MSSTVRFAAAVHHAMCLSAHTVARSTARYVVMVGPSGRLRKAVYMPTWMSARRLADARRREHRRTRHKLQAQARRVNRRVR